MKHSFLHFEKLLLALVTLSLVNCQSTQTMSARSNVSVLNFTNDSPVGAVMVTSLGGGAPGIILAQQLDQQTVDVSKQPSENLKLEADERIALNSLFQFDRNSYQITSAMENNLSKVVRILKKYPTANVLIEGYTDSAGSSRQNFNLSKKRANALAEYLVHRNIKSNRIQARGYGDAQPLFSNKSAQGRLKNRRVEVLVVARCEK